MKELLKKILGSEVVRYYPSLSKYVGGATTGLYLSQLLYWNFNEKMQNKLTSSDGWFYISIKDMSEQTGLTEREQDTARKRLSGLGVIEISYKGRSPKTTHFKLNVDKLEELITQRTFTEENQTARNALNEQRETRSLNSAKRAEFNTDTTDTTKDINKEKNMFIKVEPGKYGNVILTEEDIPLIEKEAERQALDPPKRPPSTIEGMTAYQKYLDAIDYLQATNPKKFTSAWSMMEKKNPDSNAARALDRGLQRTCEDQMDFSKFPEDSQPLLRIFVEKTGITPMKKEIPMWQRDVSEWIELHLTSKSIDDAIKRCKNGDKKLTIRSPKSVTAIANSMMHGF